MFVVTTMANSTLQNITGTILLAGAGKKDGKPLRISASYPDNRKNDFLALKKGDRVRIKGECAGEVFGSIILNSAIVAK